MSSRAYTDQDLPEVIQILTMQGKLGSYSCNRNLDRKGNVYLCSVGAAVSAVGTPGSQMEFPSPTDVQKQRIDEEGIVATADKAERHTNEDRRSDSFIRIIGRSLPFLAFVLIAMLTPGVSGWNLKEKGGFIALIALLFAASIYAWWPRRQR